MREFMIGVVAHRTGRLAAIGRTLVFAARLFPERLPVIGTTTGFRRLAIRVADSGSDPAGARRATETLIADGARVVLTLGGTATLPAVAGACRRAGVVCVSTTLPWQVYRATVPGLDDGPPRSFHLCWGLDDIADAFADAWRLAADGSTDGAVDGSGDSGFGPGAAVEVGCLWNDGAQGELLRRPELGFLSAARRRDCTPIDLGAYAEGEGAFDEQVRRLRSGNIRLVTAAATPDDLGAFDRAAAAAPPALITCSRWLSYPFGARWAGVENVVTAVYWSPRHPFRSALDGLTPDVLAARYEQATGASWCQPVGPAYALFEVAAHALHTAADPDDPAALAEAITADAVPTVAGVLDWRCGPHPAVAALPLVTGQWRDVAAGGRLVITANTAAPDVPISGELRLR